MISWGGILLNPDWTSTEIESCRPLIIGLAAESQDSAIREG